MTVGLVGADAEQVCSVSLDGFISVTEALRLTVSAGGEVLRIEIKDSVPASSPFREPELPVIVAEGVEIRGYCPGLEHSPVRC